MNTSQSKRLLTSVEVSKELNISERTVWKWSTAGQLPKPVRLGGVTRWVAQEIEDWLLAKTQER